MDLTRIGYHYYADEAHYTQRDLNAWLPVLNELKAHRIILRGSLKRSIPELFVRNLVEHSITPIIHIPAEVGVPKEVEIFPMLQTYAKSGIRYVVIGDKPNMRTAWKPEDWSKNGIVERFVDHLLPILKAQHSVGLFPVLPPLEPGGDYWDTTFLMNTLQSLRRRADQELLASLRLSVYAWTYSRPLSWGKGGPNAWPDTRPYQTPIGSEDQLGLRIFDWYQAIAEKSLGRQAPMVVIAGGPGPRLNEDSVKESSQPIVLDILRSMIGNEIPEYVENFSFYLLSDNANQESQELAWFQNPRSPNPVAEAVIKFLKTIDFKPEQRRNKRTKSFPDYFLIANDIPTQGDEWEGVLKEAAKKKAVLGFAIDEACRAENVYLIGFEPANSFPLEKRLQKAGCEVHYATRKVEAFPAEINGPETRAQFHTAKQPRS